MPAEPAALPAKASRLGTKHKGVHTMPNTAGRLAFLTLLPLLALALVDPAAAAQTSRREQMIQRLMDRLDTNHDGAVTRAEAEAAQRDRFESLDSNGDGAVSSEEFMAYEPEIGRMPVDATKRAAWLQKRFKRLDRDNDGKVTEAEFLALGSRRFAAADADGDGRVTAEELRTRWWGTRGP
jgi:Ca2+-binding EF-hand superfamily protein